jgi:hypothetical protein
MHMSHVLQPEPAAARVLYCGHCVAKCGGGDLGFGRLCTCRRPARRQVHNLSSSHISLLFCRRHLHSRRASSSSSQRQRLSLSALVSGGLRPPGPVPPATPSPSLLPPARIPIPNKEKDRGHRLQPACCLQPPQPQRRPAPAQFPAHNVRLYTRHVAMGCSIPTLHWQDAH